MVCGVIVCAGGDWLESELFTGGHAHGRVIAFPIRIRGETVHQHPSITKGY